jgi:NADPH2:quinone reductase
VLEVRSYAINRGELTLLERRPDGWRPGQDVAGVVVRAAADGSAPPEGARAVAIVAGGGWAERVAVRTEHAAVLPDEVTFEDGASLPIAGLTALRAIRTGGVVLGREVLVTGATGGVGHFAVQLATAAGALVCAHVSGPEREEAARSLGARQVVWSLEDEGLGPFHFVLDGVGGATLRAAVHRMAPGGTAATYGTLAGAAELSLEDFSHAPNAKMIPIFHAVPEEEKGADLALLAGLVSRGQLVPHLGLVDDWRETLDALAAMRARRVRGRVVMRRT